MDDSIAELRVGIARLARAMRLQRTSEAVSDSQLGAVFALHFDGSMPIGRLAAHERVRPSSMNYTVNVLARQGLVERTTREGDSRGVDVDLTSAGHELVATVLRERDAWLSDRVRALSSEERARLLAVIPILKALYES